MHSRAGKVLTRLSGPAGEIKALPGNRNDPQLSHPDSAQTAQADWCVLHAIIYAIRKRWLPLGRSLPTWEKPWFELGRRGFTAPIIPAAFPALTAQFNGPAVPVACTRVQRCPMSMCQLLHQPETGEMASPGVETKWRRHHTCALPLPRHVQNWSQAEKPAETITHRR